MKSHLNILYKLYGGDYHLLDLYLPDHITDKMPLVVFVHGGAWVDRSKEEFAPLGEALASRGFPCAIPNYRLSKSVDENSAVQHPQHVLDIKCAVDYLTTHFEDLTLLPLNGIVLMGHSCGACMVSQLVLDEQFNTHIERVIGVQGIYDLPLLVEHYPAYVEFVEPAFGPNVEEVWLRASPTHLCTRKRSVQFLLVQATQDELLDHTQTQAFQRALSSEVVTVNTVLSGTHYSILTSDALVDTVVTWIMQHPLE
jgi:acetyl esterase/lipase